jgi:hypothetical protein
LPARSEDEGGNARGTDGDGGAFEGDEAPALSSEFTSSADDLSGDENEEMSSKDNSGSKRWRKVVRVPICAQGGDVAIHTGPYSKRSEGVMALKSISMFEGRGIDRAGNDQKQWISRKPGVSRQTGPR